MDSMERLQAFHAVAKDTSFSKAALRIYRTQPAVSQAVKALELELGERLFLRRGRGVVLTQAGRILIEYVERAFVSLDRAKKRIEALQELRTGELTIATSDTTACYILPDVLNQFYSEYPEIELKIMNRSSPQAASSVIENRADLAIITMPLSVEGLIYEELAVREDVAIIWPNHPFIKRKRIKLSDLLSFPIILLDRGSNTRSFIDEQINKTGVVPKITMELASIEVIKKMVSLGLGVSIVPFISVEKEVGSGELFAVKVFSRTESRHLGIASPADGLYSLAARVFVRMLKEYAKERAVL